MIDPLDKLPNQDPPSDTTLRLDAISKANPENSHLDLAGVVDELMGVVFKPKRGFSGMNSATLVGGSDDAVKAVGEGVLQRLEKGSKAGLTGEKLSGTLWPISKNFIEPEPVVLEAMKRRTDEIESLFSVDELQEAINRSNGRVIQYSGETTHPEYSWVEVSADNHTSHGITYNFFRQKPSEDDLRPLSDFSARIHIGFMSAREAPSIVNEEHPYFTQMYYSQEREENDFESETSLDVPDDLTAVLSEIAKKMVVETLVEQARARIEGSEKTKKIFNEFAKDVVAKETDPVKVRDLLERAYIYEEPGNFE